MDTRKAEWLWQCTIPDNTELQEHTLKTNRCIIVGERCTIDYGLKGEEILVSEFCRINGNISSDGDFRLDNWSEVTGDIYVNGDAFLGEGVRVTGKLVVEGDLDLGDNVQIAQGFEARGWISIRNPMPVITYILLYLIALLGLEKEEEISDFFKSLVEEDESEKSVPLVIPPNSVLDMERFSSPGKMTIGKGSRLHGNIRAKIITIHEKCTIFGSLSAEKDILIMESNTVHGAVTSSSGNVEIRKDSHVLGDVSCKNLVIDEKSHIDGVIVAPGGVKIQRDT
jgi:predicted acyltransferase (DUF342 family)